nr:MAG TPA: hypothetical protein [Crassvirales sp.]
MPPSEAYFTGSILLYASTSLTFIISNVGSNNVVCAIFSDILIKNL